MVDTTLAFRRCHEQLAVPAHAHLVGSGGSSRASVQAHIPGGLRLQLVNALHVRDVDTRCFQFNLKKKMSKKSLNDLRCRLMVYGNTAI